MDRGATADDGRTLTVRVPLTFRKRGGRKQVVTPEGASWRQPRTCVDNTMVKAIARAHRWQRLIETGTYGTIDEIARAEKINPSYVSRVLRLTLLAPDIIEAILDGRQGIEITLTALIKPFPIEWERQINATFHKKYPGSVSAAGV